LHNSYILVINDVINLVCFYYIFKYLSLRKSSEQEKKAN